MILILGKYDHFSIIYIFNEHNQWASFGDLEVLKQKRGNKKSPNGMAHYHKPSELKTSPK